MFHGRPALAFWIGVASISASGADCPAKFSSRLCPLFESAPDTAYLDVRIILDAKVESGFVWTKGPTPELTPPRPLRVYSESLIIGYDLRQPRHPESAYVRLYGPKDPNPAIEQVQYHNAAVTKANLRKLAAETYVAGAETACNRRIVSGMCTELNRRADPDTVPFGISFQGDLQSDSIARKAFLARFAVRESIGTDPRCQIITYSGTPVSIYAMADDPGISQITFPRASCILSLGKPSSPRARGKRDFREGLPADRRLDGRAWFGTPSRRQPATAPRPK